MATEPETVDFSKDDPKPRQKVVFSPFYAEEDTFYERRQEYAWREQPVIDTGEAYNVLEELDNLVQSSPRNYEDEEFDSNWFHPGKSLQDDTLEVSNTYAEQELENGEITYRFRNYRRENGRYVDEVEVEIKAEPDRLDGVLEEVTEVYNRILESSGSEKHCIDGLQVE